MDKATTADSMGRGPTLADTLALRGAASDVSLLLHAGLEMDEATTAAAFLATADAVDPAKALRKQELVT